MTPSLHVKKALEQILGPHLSFLQDNQPHSAGVVVTSCFDQLLEYFAKIERMKLLSEKGQEGFLRRVCQLETHIINSGGVSPAEDAPVSPEPGAIVTEALPVEPLDMTPEMLAATLLDCGWRWTGLKCDLYLQEPPFRKRTIQNAADVMDRLRALGVKV